MLQYKTNRRPPQPIIAVAIFLIIGLAIGWTHPFDIWVILPSTLLASLLLIATRRNIFVPLMLLGIGITTTTAWRNNEAHVSETHREESSCEWAHNINSWAYSRLEELDLSPDALSVAGAMLLGRRDLMDRQLTLSYRESGAAHILAVSGLHLAIIFLVVNNLLLIINIFPYGHIARKILIIIILWLYAAIVGMSPSVVRAASMLTLYQFISLIHRRYYSINALLIAVVAMVLLDPSILFDVGFQLSVVAVLGILFWAAPLLRPLDRWSWSQNWGPLMPILFESVVATLIVGVACSVALLPLISYTFGYVSLLGILLNPLLIVTTFITLTVSLLWVLFGFGELPALIVGQVIEGMTLIQNYAVGSIAEPIALRLELWETLSIYLLYGLITLLCYRVKRAHFH
ncbi:MAG: ComEC/Rec2 family competence protein [Rikenellaceae bacterium]